MTFDFTKFLTFFFLFFIKVELFPRYLEAACSALVPPCTDMNGNIWVRSERGKCQQVTSPGVKGHTTVFYCGGGCFKMVISLIKPWFLLHFCERSQLFFSFFCRNKSGTARPACWIRSPPPLHCETTLDFCPPHLIFALSCSKSRREAAGRIPQKKKKQPLLRDRHIFITFRSRI